MTNAGGRHMILKRALEVIREAAGGPVSMAYCERATNLIAELMAAADGGATRLGPALEHIGVPRSDFICHVREAGDGGARLRAARRLLPSSPRRSRAEGAGDRAHERRKEPEMTDPIQELMDEHRIIEKALDAIDDAAERTVPLSFYEKVVEFVAEFADGCHHAKEEGRLFPVLERLGVPRDYGPIGVMSHEHDVGRGLMQRMRAQIADGDLNGLRRTAREYTGLMRQHIRKEDDVLFPMARQICDDGEMSRLRRSFDEVSCADGCHPRFVKLAEQLAAEVDAAT